MTDMAWIHGALTAARPQAVGVLLRYFRDMDLAEEAYQDACLRALHQGHRPGQHPGRGPAYPQDPRPADGRKSFMTPVSDGGPPARP